MVAQMYTIIFTSLTAEAKLADNYTCFYYNKLLQRKQFFSYKTMVKTPGYRRSKTTGKLY